MDKLELLKKIKALDGLSNDEKAILINLVNTNKKYGLVWEDKPEDVEEELLESVPVLIEDKNKFINGKPLKKKKDLFLDVENGNGKFPNHILIEGDNLHALTALTFTHEGKIDSMYFDPPYNTGAKDWRYNNDYVEKEDSFKHSKWLSMMEKRLKIAKRLLNESGIICVTIDDYEMPRLFILMENIFGEENHLGTIVIRNNPSGRSTVKGVSVTHEYGIFFGKSNLSEVGRLERNEKQINRYDLFDNQSAFEWVNFRKHGGTRKESPSMFYPIYVTKNKFRIPKIEWDEKKKEWKPKENPFKDETVVYPIDDNGLERRWKWGIERVKQEPKELCVKKDRNGELGVYVKARLNDKGILPLTWWDKKEYSATAYGTNLIKEIFGELQIFSYPKSLFAVVDSLKVLSSKNNAIILDVFAGSGTTLHATMLLNSEDGGNRQCILVTNNENKIAEEVCYERNKKVINGYKKQNGEKVEGMTNNNLRYYKTTFVGREKTTKNKKELTQLATELLCIKEDCYDEIKSPKNIRLFHNDSINLMVIYDDNAIPNAVEIISKFPKGSLTKVYVFSEGQDPYTEDFSDVADKVSLCALPDSIYKAYQFVLPKKSRKGVPHIEEIVPVSENGNGQLTLETQK